MTKATYRRKTFFWLLVPEGKSIFMGEDMASGGRIRKPRDHIFHCKHEKERANCKWGEASSSQSPSPVTCSSSKTVPPNGSTSSPNLLWTACYKPESVWDISHSSHRRGERPPSQTLTIRHGHNPITIMNLGKVGTGSQAG